MNTTAFKYEDFNDLNNWKRLAFLELAIEQRGELEAELVSKVLNINYEASQQMIENAYSN